MQPPEEKTGDVRIWLITFLFFLLILTGGVLLVLYITLPETDEAAGLAIAGIVLVSIPWIFWILNCICCIIFPRLMPVGDSRNSPVKEEAVESPSGERKVRFGAATVFSSSKDGGEKSASNNEVEGSGVSRIGNDDASSSLCSHESEAPLALSVS
ncbi:hypothetical protein KSP39_PZI006091 [Platanthera zijinensis]|uniref:Uncharacterized protein n=1 Tax=Platanthera zijinensis TaxID=2320716 RepID=A0AAP0GAK8_9ASPA